MPLLLLLLLFNPFVYITFTDSGNTDEASNGMAIRSGVPREGGGFNTPEIPKALQNRAKLNTNVKNVKNLI